VVSTIFGDISLSIGAFFIAIFVAWVWGVASAVSEIESEDNSFEIKRIWVFMIRFVAPITILIVFLFTVWSTVLT
jgi:NSS family neurotransmitter:Na+ symporter